MPEVERLISEGNRVTLKVKGNSMLPFIVGSRDSVVLKRLDRTPKEGDIVLARLASKRYVIHRIYKIESYQITLMGDGNILIPEICQLADISGTVVEIITPTKSKNPFSKSQKRAAKLWLILKPLRRYLLFIYRGLLKTDPNKNQIKNG